MNEELKRDYQEARIPEEASRRARDRAWRRVSPPPRSGLRTKWAPIAAVALATLVMAAILWPLAVDWLTDSRPAPLAPPAPAVVRNPVPQAPIPTRAEAELRTVPPAAAHAGAGRMAGQHNRAAKGAPAPPGSEARGAGQPRRDRLVINLTLPETGVRMIWILDEDFGKPMEAHND